MAIMMNVWHHHTGSPIGNRFNNLGYTCNGKLGRTRVRKRVRKRGSTRHMN
jgi:hypothetical protein